MVMPAFGAYTGGLNVRDRAFADVCSTRWRSRRIMLGDAGSMPSPAMRCLPD